LTKELLKLLFPCYNRSPSLAEIEQRLQDAISISGLAAQPDFEL